jgi:hypothetical protein
MTPRKLVSWLTWTVEWCYKNITLLAIIVGCMSIGSLIVDVFFIHLIPTHYYRIPVEGDTFPVHGRKFWSLIAYVFVLNFISSFLATLYAIWKWKKAFVGRLPSSTVTTITLGLETFLTFTQFLSVLLAIGHLYYLLAIIASKSLVNLVIIGAMPLPDEHHVKKAATSTTPRQSAFLHL